MMGKRSRNLFAAIARDRRMAPPLPHGPPATLSGRFPAVATEFRIGPSVRRRRPRRRAKAHHHERVVTMAEAA